MKMIKSQILCTFVIILIFFTNLSEERPMNRGREVKSLSGFGAIIQTEQSKALETESQYSNQIHSIVKRLTNGGKSSPDTGYAGIITTEETKNRKKKRHCEEWIKIPIINQMKCTKLIWTHHITRFPNSSITQK